MKNKASLTVDIPLPVDVVTGETCSRVVQKVIEVLLYQRSQIPFCFDNFRTMVSKFDRKETETEMAPEWKDYRLVKQRKAAVDTVTQIKQMFKELPTVTSQGSSVLVLFGSTVYTAKEAFQVNLPLVNPHHYRALHRSTLETALKHLAKVMTLSEDLQTGSEIITGPTKMFLLLNRAETTPSTEPCSSWQRLEEFRLPASCRRHVINLYQKGGEQRLTCCKELHIYEEEGDEELGHDAMEIEGENEEEPEQLETAWYQIGEGLKGYKDVEVNGKLIWNCGL